MTYSLDYGNKWCILRQTIMYADRQRWNKKYAQKDTQPILPSGVLSKFYQLAPSGRALDLAAGNGRNACFLAQRGYVVDAVDISEIALKQYPRRPNLHPICADLDTFDISPSTYQLILNIRFLNRRLFPYMIEGLKSGGCLICDTFLESPDSNKSKPTCRDYLLRENELLHAFIKLRILYYAEGQELSDNEPYHGAVLVALKP
jgi:SAM-dependent methyltransferase